MKLIAQMIGKDEADRFLTEVLEHLRPMVDEIIFTDDASSDNTGEIAASFGAHLHRNESCMFVKHEGLLRQRAWERLSEHAEVGDWVLAIDCDEKLYTTLPDITIRDLMVESNYDVINIEFIHMWNEDHFRIDKLWKPTGSSRLFKYKEGGKFTGRALACGSEPTYVGEAVRRRRYMFHSGLVMQHLGYVRDEDKQAKYDRYMELDKGKFHNIDHLKSILDPNPTLAKWNGEAVH